MGKTESNRFSTHQFMEAWSKHGKEKDYKVFIQKMIEAAPKGEKPYTQEQIEGRLLVYKDQMVKAGIAKSKIPKHPKPKTPSCVAWFQKKKKEASAT
jgi:hypothetical protein